MHRTHCARAFALAAAALLPAPAALAQVYRSVTPDGQVIFSDQPPPNAVRTEQLAEPEPRPVEREGEAAQQAEENRAARAAIEAQRRARAADVSAADKEVREAERDLAAARKRLAEGRVEGEGDRTGIVGRRGGGARQSDAYLDRVGRLEADVAQAEARLKAAREAARQARTR